MKLRCWQNFNNSIAAVFALFCRFLLTFNYNLFIYTIRLKEIFVIFLLCK